MALRALNMSQAAYVDSRLPNTPRPLNSGDTVLLHRDDENGEGCRLYLSFASWPSSLKRKKLLGVGWIGVYGGSWYDNIPYFVYASSATFNKNTLTWNNKPAGTNPQLYDTDPGPEDDKDVLASDKKGWDGHPAELSVRERSEAAKAILRNKSLYLYPGTSPKEEYIDLVSGEWDNPQTPYINIYYDDGADLKSQITGLNNTSGYVNPAVAQKFKWDFLSANANYVCAGDFAQASASFFWKVHSSGSYTEVQASGNTKNVTIPANTFPGNSTIDWYVSGTDEDGTATTSPVYSFTTADADAVAAAVSPQNTVEDGSAPITFRWTISNSYGNPASRVEVLWKQPNDANWTTLTDQNASITSYTAAANTFPAGEILWKVRAYNADSVAGDYSEASFVCVAAPGAPDGISSDGVPYATITWQCSGQQAYEVIIDGISQGVRFGTGKSITLDEPLEDGEHTVTIKAQGVYGLWSEAGTAVITVENTPGDAITLSGRGGLDAILQWTTDAADLDFYIYRDGVKIGHTASLNFVDRLTLGNHNYYVINRLPSGNYTKSDSVSIRTATEYPVIAEFPPRSWTDIRLTENSDVRRTFSYSKTAGFRHYYGANYPVAEISPFDDATATFNTAFLTAAEARTFETLKGKAVCVKSRMGILFVGVMSTLQRSVNAFYTAYSFTLQRIQWEDFIDDTNG